MENHRHPQKRRGAQRVEADQEQGPGGNAQSDDEQAPGTGGQRDGRDPSTDGNQKKISDSEGILEIPPLCDSPGADSDNCMQPLDKLELDGPSSVVWHWQKTEPAPSLRFSKLRPGMPLSIEWALSGDKLCQSSWFVFSGNELQFAPTQLEISGLPQAEVRCLMEIVARYPDRRLPSLWVTVMLQP